MKCSSCSREVKPIIAFDIDGTLGDYHGHFRRFAQQYLQRVLPDLWHVPPPDEGISHRPYGWESNQEFSEYLGIEKEEYRRIKLAYRQGGLKRSMPVYNEMANCVHQAAEAGCEIWLTTTRPWMSHNNLHPDTEFWCKQAGIWYDSLLYDEDKYQVLADAVDHERVLLIVDDLPEQWDAAAVVFGVEVPVLKATTYNRWYSRSPHVGISQNGAMLSATIRLRMEEWKRKHAMV
jgi:hypothetical protein